MLDRLGGVLLLLSSPHGGGARILCCEGSIEFDGLGDVEYLL